MKYGHYEYKEAEKFLIKTQIAEEVIKHANDANPRKPSLYANNK